jgi:cytochrome c
MSDLFFNKLAFCVLGASLLMSGLDMAGDALFSPMSANAGDGPPIQPLPPGVPEQPRDYHALFAAADVAKGEATSHKCETCHSLAAGGGIKTGPPLFGVLGRNVGSAPGFKSSGGSGSLSELGGAWTYEKLDHFLERPKGYAPRTAMTFNGIKALADRINLIAYLRTLTNGEPEPLP